ncbi:flagellar biosynthesis anti-sigma factor FlgM [Fervidibacillus albus]|uniref:Negative regulator of flagellin synthesis n=1 Tax=Fervidibacillus albus TaxID=2980026 RepID=A0A9E8LUE1_9BACI|nr:flagellar biosynthesis anti-sigma factor FlgM [Fervidibacillus albus]WAA09784.1 flagellar biosynthesis anti-sigma factor FlgM [Fervidibacillus albus]
MKITNHGTSGLNPYVREWQKANQQTTRTGNEKDKIEISQEAMEMQKQGEPTKQEKIAQLKTEIENGTYVVDPHKLAEKLLTVFHQKGETGES